MRTIKKVLGLVLAVTICVLGLASCGDKYTTEYEDTKTGETKSISGDLYAMEYGNEPYPIYMLLGEDGIIYNAGPNTKPQYKFIKSQYSDKLNGTWEQLSDNIYRIGTVRYYKEDKWLIAFGNGQTYIKVDGIANANE